MVGRSDQRTLRMQIFSLTAGSELVVARGSDTVLTQRRRDPADVPGSPRDWHADVAQLVEHHLAKVRVAGSNPVVRSEARLCGRFGRLGQKHAPTAEWPSGLGKGLQSPVHGFDSRLRLPLFCDQRKHPFRVRADRSAVLATRSCVRSLGAQDITQGSPRRDLTMSRSATSPASAGRPRKSPLRLATARRAVPRSARGTAACRRRSCGR